ncbi:hypothetical protein DFH09DRAFT_1106606 [Mycena vulgaris]|nr:hypothetical protein DFH09DRAFT_1106606 [Mycena vulgaris]
MTLQALFVWRGAKAARSETIVTFNSTVLAVPDDVGKKIEGLQIKLKAFRVFKTGLKAFRTDTEFTRHMSSEVYGIRGHFPYKKKRYMITARVQTSVVRYSTRVSGEHGGYEGYGNSQGWRKNYFSSVKSRQAGGHQEAPWVLPERRRRVETPQRELVHKLNHGDAGFNTSAASPDNLIRRASLLSPRPISPPQERAQSQVSRYKLLLDVQLSTTTPGDSHTTNSNATFCRPTATTAANLSACTRCIQTEARGHARAHAHGRGGDPS